MNGASGGAEQLPPNAPGPAALPTAVWLVPLCLLFLALAAVDLADVRPVSGDDALILTVSAHLSETGRLGSPLHDGVFAADEHYFLNLPLQHVLHAAVFRVFGEGVAQARVVSLIAAIALLCASTVLARRWFGARVAVITALLLVVWRSGLIGLDYGLPLLAAARTARYDITAVALLWLAVVAFDSHMRRPGPARAFTVGVLAAAAMLTQFHGALILPALAALWLGDRASAERRAGLLWPALGLLLGLAPYVAYFASHAADALAQVRLVHAARIGDGPAGLLRSVVTEPLRFSAAATQRGIGQFGVPLALGVTGVIAFTTASMRESAPRHTVRSLLLVTLAMLIALALFEPTKAALYALPLVPALCTLLAVALDALWRWDRSGNRTRPGAARAAALVLGALLVAEGIVALTRDRVAAAGATSYAVLAAEIDAAIPAGAGVMGPAQWSWGLRTHPYAEVRAVALRQRASAIAGRSVPTVEAATHDRGVRYVLVNDDVRGELRRGFYGEPFGRTLISFIEACTSPVRSWSDATYGSLELRAVKGPCAAGRARARALPRPPEWRRDLRPDPAPQDVAKR